MSVVARFAPSPTGFLHIGGARTALFNWLFARHHGGAFRLRIEDTDRARSTDAAVAAIFDGLAWLGLDHDGDAVFQSANAARHAAVARRLLADNRAYRCFCTPEELAEMRARARAAGHSARYDGRWRDRDPAEAPPGIDPVVRIKMPRDGATTIDDAVQGTVTVEHAQLDDFVIVRADGTPTYMLAVVVDDHDMGVTHVIRGDDHLNNAFRQYHLYAACGWTVPTFAHIPLIHGPDGAKLSKRHGALGVAAYRDAGYLPDALRNYLLRLGWSHGDDEIVATRQAIEWFSLAGVGRAAARFDRDRLDSLNAHYLRRCSATALVDAVTPHIEPVVDRALGPADRDRLAAAMPSLKGRAKTLVELAEKAAFYCRSVPLPIEPKAARSLAGEGLVHLAALAPRLAGVASWEEAALEAAVRDYAGAAGVTLGAVAAPLRAALTGATASPGLFEVMAILGREEVAARIAAAAEGG